MTARTRLFAGLTATLCAVTLSGCQKPTPLVTLVSGATSVHTGATIFCFEGQSAAAQDCRTEAQTPTVLKVKVGAQVGVDVAKKVADAGWVIVLPGNDQDPSNDQASGTQTSHYFAFTPQFQCGPLRTEVRMLAKGQPAAPTGGTWPFGQSPE